jgi:hypothetical protein
MPDEKDRPVNLPPGAIHVGTDPRGKIVWISKTTQEKFVKHSELVRSPEHTLEAVTNPAIIAQHPIYPDREIYVGLDRQSSDMALAPARRILIVSKSTSPAGMFITGFDEVRSALRTEIGAVEWRARGGT